MRPEVSYSNERAWYALGHRIAARPMTQYMTAIVTPLAVSNDIELALRRVGERAPEGDDIGSHLRYRDVVAHELPEVSVDRIRGHVSPSACPFELDSLGLLCAAGGDSDLEPDGLATSSGRWIRPIWRLFWLTDAAEHGGW
jgi:hypothetical protein